MSLEATITIIGAYLVGSIPMSYLVAKKVRGIDLRQYGSRTLGGSNVYYNVGKWYFLPTAGFDALVKGVLLTALAKWSLNLDFTAQALVGLSAVLGHNWSIYLRFSGGRGLATAAGVLAILAWKELVILTSAGCLGWIVFRNSGLFFLIGMLLLPPVSILLGEPSGVFIFTTGFLLVTILKRLTAGGQPRPPGITKVRLLLYRLFYDRDTPGHDEWVRHNISDKPKQK